MSISRDRGGFERIETPINHRAVHIRYRLADAELARVCATEPDGRTDH